MKGGGISNYTASLKQPYHAPVFRLFVEWLTAPPFMLLAVDAATLPHDQLLGNHDQGQQQK